VRHSWGTEQIRQVLECVGRTAPSGKIELDEEAGENWARVVLGSSVVCLLSVKCPLAIVIEQYLPRFSECVSNVIVVSVRAMESEDYTASHETVRRLRGAEPPVEFNPRRFSMDQLWWATV
jgi:hypothetical protein